MSPTSMTPKERVLAVLRGEPVDKVPFTIYESKIPQCEVERRLRNLGLCIVERRVSAVRTERPHVRTETLRYTEDGIDKVRTTHHTPVGDLFEVSRPAGFTSWNVSRLFKSPQDYRPLLFLIQDEQYRPNYEEFAEARRRKGEDVILRAALGGTPLHTIMIHWMGLETFATEWVERRDEIERLVSAWVEKKRELYELVARSPASHANYGGNEVPEVMGVERFEEYVLPLYKEAAEVFHRHGKLLGSHLDGNNRPWAHLVAESGLDYVEAFTPAPDTDMTLAEALTAWPDKVLWINFPSSIHVASIERIEEVTRDLIDEAGDTNRLIIGITEDIPEDRWQENLLAISRVIDRCCS